MAEPATSTATYIAVWTIFFVLATTFLALRLYTRIVISAGRLWIDDYLAIAGWFFLIGIYVPMIVAIPIFQTLLSEPQNVTLDQTILSLKCIFLDYYMWNACTWTMKGCLFALYSRIFYRSMKVAFWLTGAYLVATYIAITLYNTFLCIPVSEQWEAHIITVQGKQVPTFACPTAHAIETVQYVGFALTVSTDILILGIPLYKTLSLKVTWSQKVALVAVFLVGIIYGAVEIIRLVVFAKSLASNPYGSPAITMMYNPLQGAMAVIIGNTPALRPLFFRSQFTRTTGASGLANSTSRSGIRPSLAQRSKIRDSWSGDEPDSEEMAILRSQGTTVKVNAPSDKSVLEV